MKKVIALLLAFSVMLCLCACDNSKNDTSPSESTNISDINPLPQDKKLIRIGVFESVSGNKSMNANKEILGIKYAHEKNDYIQIGEDKYEIELVVADTKSTKQGAVEAAQFLVASSVSAVIGSSDALSLSKAAEIFKEASIPVFVPSVSYEGIFSKYSNIFSFATQNDKYAQKLAEYVCTTLGKKKTAIFSVLGDEESQSTAFYFKEKLESLGGKGVDFVIEKSTDDIYDYILGVQKNKCDSIFVALDAEYAEKFLSCAVENEIGLPIVSTYKWDVGKVFEAVKETSQLLYTFSFCMSDTTSEFDNAFREWMLNKKSLKALNDNSNVIGGVSVVSFDAYNFALKVIEKSKSTNAKEVLSCVSKTTLDGNSGKISFENSNILQRSVMYIKKTNNYTSHWSTTTQMKIS